MKTTIFLFHPDINSSVVNKRLVEEAKKIDVEIRDMYRLYPDFQIDKKTEQKILEKTDRILLQFPLYWYSSPALLKEWEDVVLEHGWAYGSNGNALKNKELLLVVSAGADGDSYQENGRFQVTLETLLKPFWATSNLIGTTFQEPLTIPGTLNMKNEELETFTKIYRNKITG